MKLIINHGFVLIMMIILFVFLFAYIDLKNPQFDFDKVFGGFGMGFVYGIIFMSGMFMLKDNTAIEYKRKKWKVDSL